jgi:RNA polymerase sigma-70 factor (ECF subfamily)
MLNLARRLGGENAEDIVQDALARAWAKRQQYDPGRGEFSSWLLSIAADQAYKHWRANARRKMPQLVVPEPDSPSDELLDLEQSVARLPARQRLAVDCYYFAGLSVAETAAVMRCSEGNVKSTLSSARNNLRHLLR